MENNELHQKFEVQIRNFVRHQYIEVLFGRIPETEYSVKFLIKKYFYQNLKYSISNTSAENRSDFFFRFRTKYRKRFEAEKNNIKSSVSSIKKSAKIKDLRDRLGTEIWDKNSFGDTLVRHLVTSEIYTTASLEMSTFIEGIILLFKQSQDGKVLFSPYDVKYPVFSKAVIELLKKEPMTTRVILERVAELHSIPILTAKDSKAFYKSSMRKITKLEKEGIITKLDKTKNGIVWGILDDGE